MIWICVSIFSWFAGVFTRRLFVVPFLILLITLSAFRYYVGSDFANYVILFDAAAEGQLIPVEPSFLLLSRFFSYYNFNFQSIIIFYSVFTYLFLYLGLREYSKNSRFLAVTLLFVYLIFYFPSLSIVRQALAASIGFWATTRYLFKDKNGRYILWIFIASFFHLSALTLLLSIILKRLRFGRVTYVFFMTFSFLLGVTVFRELIVGGGGILGISSNHLSEGKTFSTVSPIFMINSFVLVCVFFYIFPKNNKKLEGTKLFLLNIVFAIIIIRMLSIEFIVFNRLASIYTVFLPLFIYTFFYQRLKKHSKAIFLLVLLPFLLLSDAFRLSKDYSYYQYSFNFCIVAEPCPIQLFGNKDPKLIKHVD